MRNTVNYNDPWQEVPDVAPYKNPYRFGWEGFINHVVADAPFYADFAAGIRDVQLAEACQHSAKDGSWIDMTQL
jgi:predicted dehydrogenase